MKEIFNKMLEKPIATTIVVSAIGTAIAGIVRACIKKNPKT